MINPVFVTRIHVHSLDGPAVQRMEVPPLKARSTEDGSTPVEVATKHAFAIHYGYRINICMPNHNCTLRAACLAIYIIRTNPPYILRTSFQPALTAPTEQSDHSGKDVEMEKWR
jgi:hypothetical protein